MNQEQSIVKHDHIISNHQSKITEWMNNQKHKVVICQHLATLRTENTNRLQKGTKEDHITWFIACLIKSFASSICFLFPVTRTILSVNVTPSGGCWGINWIRAPDLVCMPLIASPPFPIMRPTYGIQVMVEHIKWHTITTSLAPRKNLVIRNCHLKLLW